MAKTKTASNNINVNTEMKKTGGGLEQNDRTKKITVSINATSGRTLYSLAGMRVFVQVPGK